MYYNVCNAKIILNVEETFSHILVPAVLQKYYNISSIYIQLYFSYFVF